MRVSIHGFRISALAPYPKTKADEVPAENCFDRVFTAGPGRELDQALPQRQTLLPASFPPRPVAIEANQAAIVHSERECNCKGMVIKTVCRSGLEDAWFHRSQQPDRGAAARAGVPRSTTMQPSSKPEMPIAVPGVILALLITSGLWWAQSPLHSPRAAREARNDAPEALLGDQTMDSRLWEDPFAAAERHDISVVSTRHTLAVMGGQVARRLADANDSVCVLAVMVDGDPYAEDAESRLRSRRAVVAALGLEGYAPADAHHVGFFEVPWQPGATLVATPANHPPSLDLLPGESAPTNAPRGGRLRIPFEWFHAVPTPDSDATVAGAKRPTQVLVWWLRDDAFQDFPLLRLGQLAESFQREVITVNGGQTNALARMSIKLVGPRTSGCLLEMLRDLPRLSRLAFAPPQAGAATNVTQVLRQIPIYSPWATIAEGVLAEILPARAGETFARSWIGTFQSGWEVCRRFCFLQPWPTVTGGLVTWVLQRERAVGSVKAAFARHGLEFHNVVPRDDELSRILIQELQLRGVNLLDRDSKDVVVLLTEFDTLYGRALPRAFQLQLEDLRRKTPYVPPGWVRQALQWLRLVRTNQIAWPTNVHVFGYLRGMDGEQPTSGAQTPATGGTTAESLREKAKRLERAEGRGQLDAIRRLAGTLLRLDQRLERDGGGIGAIGLFGSDVPDKLVALQALRPEFPNTLFFTTDLDARLFHPAELRWARNLVVASGYDLRLRDDLSRGLAPFREAYQTAQFVACRAALGQRELTLAAPSLPLVFEVGNNGPVLLSQTFASVPLHPTPMDRRSWCKTLGVPLLVTLLLGAVLLAVFPTLAYRFCSHCGDLRWTSLRERHGAPFAWLVVAAALALALMPWFYAGWIRGQSDSMSVAGEPFSWLDGVSVWPTEILRLLVVYLGVFFCLRTRAKLRENKEALCKEFALPQRLRDREAVRAWWARKEPVLAAHARRGAAAGSRRDRLWLRLPGWLRYRSAIGISRLGLALLPPGAPPNPNRKATLLWEDYNVLGYSLNRLFRFVPIVILYVIGAVMIFLAFDFPFVPFRGTRWEKIVSDVLPLTLSVVAQLMLIFFVLDATMLCRRMIQVVVAPHVGWPRATYVLFRRRLNLRNPRCFEPWLDALFIARRTAVIMPLIYYPFIVLALMIVSRLDVFDRWDWPPSLIIVTGLNAVFALIAAFSLRQAAERARQVALAALRRKQLQLLGQPNQAAAAKQVETLAREVEELREGAFAPLAEQPLVRALLLPFGGAGLVALLEGLAHL